MPKAASDPGQRETAEDVLRARLKALDGRIVRMREMHADSADPLAHRLIDHSIAERDEVRLKLSELAARAAS